ncbi:uncharacterized protein LOC135341044 [Halichondria panicea]|uniref:uncharacterized protein LOC135341044 n=1 Tax=Halichondria panicea TaxID=6063 RepID=UPI00312BA09E
MNTAYSLSNSSRNNCSVFDSERYVVVALVSASSASLSFLACTAVIFLIVSLRKYIFFVQRLILYLCICALLNSFAIALRFQQVKDLPSYTYQNSESLHVLCVITAFIDQTTAWAETIAICCITFNLLMTAVFNKDTERFEIVYVALIVILPLTFNWIPFLHNAYGEAGAWCWIKNIDDNCKPFSFGSYAVLFLWYIPSTTILVIVILVYAFIVIWVTRKKQIWTGKLDLETERKRTTMQREVLPLMLYPLGFLILNLFPFINRIHDTIVINEPSYPLWMLHAIVSPLQGGYIAVIYTLDKDTRKRLNCRRFKAALFHKEPTISEYPTERGTISDSLPPSKGNVRIVTVAKESSSLYGSTDTNHQINSTEKLRI